MCGTDTYNIPLHINVLPAYRMYGLTKCVTGTTAFAQNFDFANKPRGTLDNNIDNDKAIE